MVFMKQVDIYIQNLKDASDNNKVTYEVMMPAINGLKGKNSIQKYYNACKRLVIENLENDLNSDNKTTLTNLIRKGCPIDEVADAQTSYLFRKFLTDSYSKKYKNVYEAWKKACPQIYSKDKLEELLSN